MSDVVAEMMRAKTAFDDPTLDLLHQVDAQVITAIFHACFPRDVREIPIPRMHTVVEDMLAELRSSPFADQVPDRSGKELCERWHKRDWLEKDDAAGGDDGLVYRLTSGAQRALQTIRGMMRDRTSVSEHRIATILSAVRDLNLRANPDRLARLTVLQQERAALEEQIDQLTSGAPMPAPSEEFMLEGFQNLLDLIGDLPGDFDRVQESFVRQRAQFLDLFRSAELSAGDVVAAFLEQDDVLMDTTEGRAFRGALELLTDPEMLARLRGDVDSLMNLPVAQDILFPGDRSELAGIVLTMTSGIKAVTARRQRVAAVLRQNIQTYNAERDRRLDEVLRELNAAFPAWLERTGPRTQVPIELVPPRPKIRHLRERWHDPRDETPVDALEVTTDPPPAPLSLEQLRALGGPDMGTLRRNLEASWASGQHPTLAQAFASLPPEHRRPADLLGALQVAADSTQVGWAPGTDPIETLRPDGAVRVFHVPRVAVGAADAPTPDELDNVVHDLLQEAQ